MQGKHTNTIRGLGIAAIALSAVTLLGCLFCAVVLGMTGSVFDGALMESLAYEFSYGYHDPLLAEGVGSIIGLTLGLLGLVVGWEVLTCVVTLIAGILGVRHAADPAKLGGVFGWSIAGAVAALLGGRLIAMGVLIALAIFAKRTQDAASVAHWQNVAAQQGQPYGHNIYAQAAPAPQYVQQYAPQQAAPAQPMPQQAVPAQPMPQQATPASYQPAYAAQPVEVQPAAAPVAEPQPAVQAQPAEPQPMAAPQPETQPVVAVEAEAAAIEAQPVEAKTEVEPIAVEVEVEPELTPAPETPAEEAK
ncbi:MAG: hypothetical protein IJO87_09465 [Eggerthellaceae bacterium]|nr:hypothetical protein [Eggerthellaceae bacterium]